MREIVFDPRTAGTADDLVERPALVCRALGRPVVFEALQELIIPKFGQGSRMHRVRVYEFAAGSIQGRIPSVELREEAQEYAIDRTDSRAGRPVFIHRHAAEADQELTLHRPADPEAYLRAYRQASRYTTIPNRQVLSHEANAYARQRNFDIEDGLKTGLWSDRLWAVLSPPPRQFGGDVFTPDRLRGDLSPIPEEFD